MPYALCPMPYARLSSVHLMLLRKAICLRFFIFYHIGVHISLRIDIVICHINSGSQAGMISNPCFIVGRKVESRGQQIIRAIFIFLTPPSTVNCQQSTVNCQQSTVNSQLLFGNR